MCLGGVFVCLVCWVVGVFGGFKVCWVRCVKWCVCVLGVLVVGVVWLSFVVECVGWCFCVLGVVGCGLVLVCVGCKVCWVVF